MSAEANRVREALDSLQSAIGQDLTAAICEVREVRNAFAAGTRELAVRTGKLEEALDELERSTPILLPFDDPPEEGWPVRAAWVRLFWAMLAVLCLAALACGFLAGRSWGHILVF